MTDIKIAFFGSAKGEKEKELLQAGCLMGELAAKEKVEVHTGGDDGWPHCVVQSAASKYGTCVGYSYALDLEEHVALGQPTNGFTHLYTLKDYMNFPPDILSFLKTDSGILLRKQLRRSACASNVDGAIICGGTTGTGQEFVNSLEYGLVVGVLANTRGLVEHIVPGFKAINIYRNERAQYSPEIIVEEDPENLFYAVLDGIKARREG